MRRLATALLAGALLSAGLPVLTTGPAVAAGRPVALVVGLRAGADVARTLRPLDVLDSAPLPGSAVTVDVPAGQVTAATAVLRADPAVSYVELDHVAYAAATTDPDADGQWGLDRTRVSSAWSTARGSGVTVAVVDTGVGPLPDLAGRLLQGHDFVNDDDDATDDNGHGTMAADVIAAAGDNGVGIAGVCWLCRILPVKVLDAGGSGSYTDIAAGIRYAADRGADVINLSLGGTSDSQLLRDAVAYAVGKGALVLAAAGNSGSVAPHYPAAFPAVLAVGGSTAGDARYPWSNHGRSWVDIAAPGCNPAQGLGGVLNQFCGTSSATPFAAGVAALLAGTTPRPDAATIRTALTSSAAPLAGNWVGSGRVDAAAALQALPFWVTGMRAGSFVGDTVSVTPHVGARAGITRVTAALDGVTAATATAAPWRLGLDTSRSTGTSTITISAYAGGTRRAVASFPVVADHTRPVTSFRSPGPSALVRGLVPVTANATDGAALSRVQLLLGGTVLATDTRAPYAFRWRSPLVDGPVTLTVRAYDLAGNATTSKRSFLVDNRAPALAVTNAPADGTRGVRRTRTMTVRAADAHGIARLELLVNGRVIQRYAGTRHTFGVQTWKYGRAMTVQVRAYDRAGNLRVAPARKWYR